MLLGVVIGWLSVGVVFLFFHSSVCPSALDPALDRRVAAASTLRGTDQACPECKACAACPPCADSVPAVGGDPGLPAVASDLSAPCWVKDFPFVPIESRRIPGYMHPKKGDTDGHAGGNYIGGNLYPQFWTFLKDKYTVKSALDVGCGLGESTRGLREAGIENVYAFDGFRENIVASTQQIQYHNLQKGPFIIGRVVDLAWASEVLEHIDYEMLPNLLLTLLQAKYLAVNAAGPGQTGHHHVVLRTWPEFWTPLFKKYGFEEVEEITRTVLQDPQYMKEKNRGHMWWALSGHSPGRVLENKNLAGCNSEIDCYNRYLASLSRLKGLPAPPPGPKDAKQAEWEKNQR